MEPLHLVANETVAALTEYAPAASEYAKTYLFEFSFVLLGLATVAAFSYLNHRRIRRALRQGHLPHEVIVTVCIFDEQPDGRVFIKPRTVQSAEPILRAFPNPALVDMIIKATKRCDTTALGSFIMLGDPTMHHTFMKRVVDIVSELGGPGHIVRACGGTFVEYVCYCCVTFSMDGPHRKVRIDLISEQDLPQLVDENYVARLTNRPEEGSHADLVAILQVCARKHQERSSDVATYVRRVSISIPA